MDGRRPERAGEFDGEVPRGNPRTVAEDRQRDGEDGAASHCESENVAGVCR